MYYYARWFYMFDLILVLATVMSMENTEVDWLKATRISAGVTVVILLLVGLMPTTSEDDKKTTLGLRIILNGYGFTVALHLFLCVDLYLS